MGFQTLKVTHGSDGVLRVEIQRPDVRNAFNEVMIQELTRVFEKDARQPEVRAVLLSGSGPVFCAGGDLSWMKKSIELSYEKNLEDTRALSRMFVLMNECPKPLVASLHGAAIGGGVGLTSVCDYVVASEETVFSLSEVRLGIVPSCIGPFVVAKIGASHARALFVSAERFKAERALEIGLIHEVAANPNAARVAAERVVGNILQAAPNAVSVAKKLVLDLTWPERRALEKDCIEMTARILAELRVLPEAQEGLEAFLQKRSPKWMKKS